MSEKSLSSRILWLNLHDWNSFNNPTTVQKGKKFSDKVCVAETNKILVGEKVLARIGIIPGLNIQSTTKYGTT